MNPWYQNRADEMQVSASFPYTFPAHLHEAMEILYVTEGCTELLVGDRIYPVKAGQIAFVFPNIIHGYLAPQDGSPEAPRGCILVIARPQETGSYEHALMTKHPRLPVLELADFPPETAGIFSQILQAHRQGNADLRRAYLQVLLATVWDRFDFVPNSDSSLQGLLYQALEYVSAHYRDSLSLESTSHALGISRYQLSRLFSGRLGMGFVTYVNALRIRHAQRLLAESDLPITEVAFACGFETPRTFNRIFRQQCDCTPSAYRRTHN